MGERHAYSELPPGIEGDLKYFTSGGEHVEWMPFTARKYYTNAFIVQGAKVHNFFPSHLYAPNSTGAIRSFWDIRKGDLEDISTRLLTI